MPPAAALCFYILGCALVLLTAGRSILCQILSLTVTTITTATLVASIYAWFAPQTLPGYLGMPAISALVLLILSLGVVSSNAHHTLLTVMTSNSVGGAMARRLLPASLLIPLVLGFLRLKGQDAGWFGPGLGLVLHVVATMLLLALFIWWNAAVLDRIARENGRFEHAVQDTQAALLEILRHVSNAAFAHDLTGNLTFFNAAAERLFGITAAEALQQNIYKVVTPQSAATVRSILSSRLIGGARHPESLVLLTSAGEQECAVLTILMVDRLGNPAGYFSLVSPLFPEIAAIALLPEQHANPVADPVSDQPAGVGTSREPDGRWLRRVARHQLQQRRRRHRLRKVVIHSGGEATLAVPGHGVRGHGDDGNVPARALFLLADQRGSFKTTHLGHLHVHEDHIEGLFLQHSQGGRCHFRRWPPGAPPSPESAEPRAD